MPSSAYRTDGAEEQLHPPCQSATTAGPNHPYAPAGDHSECTHQRFLPAALRCIFTRCMSPRVHEPLPKATEDPTANRGTSLGNRQKSDQQASWASAACGKCHRLNAVAHGTQPVSCRVRSFSVSSVRSAPVLVVSCVVSGRVRSRFAGSVGYRPPVPRSPFACLFGLFSHRATKKLRFVAEISTKVWEISSRRD